ncbi:glycosyltransferase family 39 protein [Deefgea sp. CFH1-16]|uniref:ArnT family glycosyltransferase n=1 Tax=Deefgea sp. CFH1-16 TaxID=2675457 RepID=UPI0015F75041|nr:glycosyltransferase family 39 protein [Deefgea sp. CFH1-16]MBM5575038.1 hypothetical protein [Deefgea sp. CFH1-16]
MAFAVTLFVLAYPGLVGHDPWKPDENTSMAIVAYFMRHSNWTIASIAEIPQFSQAPLYYWVATLLANALSWFGIAAHDAARLSTGLWMGLGMWGTGLAARDLFGRRFGRMAVIILLGCLGLPLWGHHVSPAVVVLAAFAWLAYALTLAMKRPLRAGVILALVFLVLLTGASWADALLAVCLHLISFIAVFAVAKNELSGNADYRADYCAAFCCVVGVFAAKCLWRIISNVVALLCVGCFWWRSLICNWA